MKKNWLIGKLAIGAMVSIAFSCVSRTTYLKAYNALQNTQNVLKKLEGHVKELEAERSSLKAELDEALTKLGYAEKLKEKKAELEKLVEKLKKNFTEVGKFGPEVEVFRKKEGVTLAITGEVLFASGSATISPHGKATLRKIAKVLIKEGRRVKIEGHTDIDPIRKSKWRSNLDLSANRAVAVAEYLAKCGVPRRLMEIAGYGEFRPRVPGTSEEAKRKNRRVEIVLLK